MSRGMLCEQPIRERRTAPIEARHQQVCLIVHYVAARVGSMRSLDRAYA